ncbi:MAG TPA: DegV family protein [Syntrophomonadaceae bacterium]|nr:DegV family protein [Syntrophomonadaceae bacterium]
MQHKTALIVDSAGSIPRDLLTKYNISEVAFHITFGIEEYRENRTITSQEFYERMLKNPNQVPKTSVPGALEWIKAFAHRYNEGYKDLIVTTIAKPLSASIQSATMAADEFTGKHPDINIHIIDSNTCAGGQAALEIKIAKLINQGELSAVEIVQRIKDFLPQVISLFSVNELTYMHAGGRIGGATAFLGKLIKIKPVCEFIDGVVHTIKPVRCRNKALQLLIDESVRRFDHAKDAVICVQHAFCQEDADFLISELKKKLNYHDHIYQGQVGAVVGAHSGPGAIGIGIAQG